MTALDFLVFLVLAALTGILMHLGKLAKLAGQSVAIQEELSARLAEIQDELEKITARLPRPK